MDTNIIQGSGTTTGINTYVVELSIGISILVKFMVFIIEFSNTNTGVSTLNINGIGAVNLVQSDGNNITPGQIQADEFFSIVYDGTELRIQSLP